MPPPPPPPGPPSTPMSHACPPNGKTARMPFCDHTLPFKARAKDLVGRMQLLDKCKMTGDGATVGGGGIPELEVRCITMYNYICPAMYNYIYLCPAMYNYI